jgi:protein-tyrosine phosphatase
MSNRVLFLGVTNHCASRFAEILFNHLACEQLLNFSSFSRGVMIKHEKEPIDPKALNALMARGVPLASNLRLPITLKKRDLQDSDYIILVSSRELATRVKRTNHIKEKKVIEWHFDKVDSLAPSELFPALEAEVYLLARRLQQQLYQDHISA